MNTIKHLHSTVHQRTVKANVSPWIAMLALKFLEPRDFSLQHPYLLGQNSCAKAARWCDRFPCLMRQSILAGYTKVEAVAWTVYVTGQFLQSLSPESSWGQAKAVINKTDFLLKRSFCSVHATPVIYPISLPPPLLGMNNEER